MRTLAIFICLAALTLPGLAGCGGSSSTPSVAAAAVAADPPPVSSAPVSSAPAALSCARQGLAGTFPSCQCPTGESYTGTGGGQTLGTCAQDPPPISSAPSSAPTAPPPPPPPAPTMNLSASPATVQPGAAAILSWVSTGATTCTAAAGWPTSDVLTVSGFATTPPLTSTTSYTLVCSGAGGNASASVVVSVAAPVTSPGPPGGGTQPTCTPPDVLISGACAPAPALSLSLAIAPVTVSDSRSGCPAPDGSSCLADVTVTSGSTLAGDSVVCDYLGSDINPAIGLSVGPWPAKQDGPQVITVSCWDVYNQTATASVVVNVVPPGAPPADTFSGVDNGDGTASFTWQTFGGVGCYVTQSNSQGTVLTLATGGGVSGTASTGFLSPSGAPYTFTLQCGGADDTEVPTITIN